MREAADTLRRFRKESILIAALLLGGFAVGVGGQWWNDPAAATMDDEHYIAIARSVPEVFGHPDADGPVQARVERSGRLAVDFLFPTERVRVFVHPRTERVEGVVRFPN